MDKTQEEIRATIARLKREGEYETYLTDKAEGESAAIAAALQAGLELTDQEVDELWRELPTEHGRTEGELKEEADDALARIIARRDTAEPPLVDEVGQEDLANRMKKKPGAD